MTKETRPRLAGRAALASFALLTIVAMPAAQGRSAGQGHSPSRDLWRHFGGTPYASSPEGHEPSVRPHRFRAFMLDRGGMAGLMAAAPHERSRAAPEQPLVVSLPGPDGEFQRFTAEESPLMEPGLAAKHPEIKTYAGRGIDDPAATIRFDLTPLGFHASVRSPQGAWYIDPYYHLDDSLYASYYGRDLLENPHGVFVEGASTEPEISVMRGFYHAADTVEVLGFGFATGAPITVTIWDSEEKFASREITAVADQDGTVSATFVADPDGNLGTHEITATDGGVSATTTYEVVSDEDASLDPPVGDQLRTYRVALLTDNTYAAYFGVANVTAAKVTLMNRVSQVYEDEISIRLLLIADNDKLNLNTAADMTGTNGPCGGTACFTAAQASTCGSSTLTRNRQVIGLLVGASNFDIGHIALGNPGGGIASLGVVGGNNKAQGCTGLPTPVGDFFAVDYVAHEMGHQFAGNHTFNGTISNCSGGNRNAATSVEPGSGSSIMAYAGICGTDNLQPHSDPYWSERSFDEIVTYTSGAEINVTEVQMGALTGFDGTDSFQLQYNGNNSATIARGANFTTAGVQAAIQGIAGWPVGGTAAVSVLGDTAFTITFGSALAGTNVSQLSLVNCSGCAGFVGEIAKGGATTRRGTVTATGNNYPIVTAPASFTIPLQTPFALTGSATDADGDTLTYMWEQNDRGAATGTGLVTQPKLNGPLFRQFGTAANVSSTDTLLYDSPGENHATTDPTRVFPDMAQILANNTDAETGACPAASSPPTAAQIDCFSEFLPTAAYVGFVGVNASPLSLHFRLTARDGRGGVNNATTTLLLANTAGPFLVTAPNTPVVLNGNSVQTVAWNVANTDGAPVSAANVKISLSIDGGYTYPYTLAATAPNDGSEPVTLPNVGTTQARIKVEAVGNVFFDVSNADFTIKATQATQTITFGAIANHTYGDPDFNVTASASSGLPVTFTASGACTVSGATVHITGAGSCAVTASQPGDAAYYPATPVTRTFLIAKAVLSVTPGPLTASRQYSDPNPPFSPIITGYVNGENASALTTVPTCAAPTATSTSGPGTHAITCSGGAAAGYDFFYTAGTLTVTREDAQATYTGDMLAFTPPGGSSAVVLLRATLRDSSVVPAFADSHPGDIRKATVTFKDGTTVLCGSLPVALIDGATTIGTASCGVLLSLGAHTIDVVVNNYYTGSAAGLVEVAQPDGSFITGGGYMLIGASGGTYMADAASRTNFGFNAKYKANMKGNLQGHANVIFRAGGRTYQIKGTAIDSLGIAFRTGGGAACGGPPSSTCFGLADFRTKANLTDITNPLIPLSLGGNLTLRITVIDRGEPGSSDSIGITLWNGNTLLFSSEWTGAQTVERMLSGGNTVVH